MNWTVHLSVVASPTPMTSGERRALGLLLRQTVETLSRKRQCDHAHVGTSSSGGMQFDHETGPDDDIHEELTCLDCGKVLEGEQSDPDPATLAEIASNSEVEE